jgi:hypothetical protein
MATCACDCCSIWQSYCSLSLLHNINEAGFSRVVVAARACLPATQQLIQMANISVADKAAAVEDEMMQLERDLANVSDPAERAAIRIQLAANAQLLASYQAGMHNVTAHCCQLTTVQEGFTMCKAQSGYMVVMPPVLNRQAIAINNGHDLKALVLSLCDCRDWMETGRQQGVAQSGWPSVHVCQHYCHQRPRAATD